MNLIDEKIIEKFYVWAKDNENKNIFHQISSEEHSYYINRISEDTYIMEYSIRTLGELKHMLALYAGLTETDWMLEQLTIEICQNKFHGEEKETKNNLRETVNENKGDIIPEFIYVF